MKETFRTNYECTPLGRMATRLSILPLSAMLSLAGGLYAQEDNEEEAFEFSPFEVDGSKDEGWIASSTLIGTRTNEKLKNVPVSVDALTDEFLSDLGIEDLTDANSWVAGLDVKDSLDQKTDDNRSSFRGLEVGGRENAQSSRNFFVWYSKTDTYNVGRVDVNKGSNSLMFGDASPGGQSVVYSKKAIFRDVTKFSAKFDSEGSNRFTLDVNRAITDNWAIRLNAVNRQRKTYLDFGEDNLTGLDFTTTFKPFEKTTLRFEFENLDYDRTRAGSRVGVEQEAAGGLGFAQNNRWYYTTDGDIASERNEELYQQDGSGEYVLIEETDELSYFGSAANGDTLGLHPGATALVYDDDGNPFVTLNGVDEAVSTYGTRDFMRREINAYTFWLEQRFGELNLELAANRLEQFQNRNDNAFASDISVDANGRYYLDSGLDNKVFGNDVDTVRLSASYPLEFGDWMSQYLVANVSYLDEVAYSFRSRLVNIAPALQEDGTYDYTYDAEGRDRIVVRAYFDDLNDLRDANIFDSLLPQNLPTIDGLFEPMWVDYTSSTAPYYDKRYSKSASLSSSGVYLDGKLRTLLGIRVDEFQLKRVEVLSNGSSDREDNVATYGELAYFGQDVNLGSPDENPGAYSYIDELDTSATTSNAGIVYELTNDLNVYANFSESFRWQGAVDFSGEVLGPQTGTTKEFGIKGTLFDDLLTVNLAVFEVARDNVELNFDSDNSSDETGLLFNDIDLVLVDELTEGDNPEATGLRSIEYVYAESDSDGYFNIPDSLGPEHRTVAASELSEGAELTILMRRTKGLQARLALSYIDLSNDVDMSGYLAEVDKAQARADERATFIAEYWPNDPDYDPESLPEEEEEILEYLENAYESVAESAGDSPIMEARARNYTAKWSLDYKFDNEFFVPNLRVLLSGRWSDSYLMEMDEGVYFYGGKTHPVDLAFLYSKKLDKGTLDLQFKIKNMIDLENTDDIRSYSGFVDEFTGEATFQYRKVTPLSAELSMSYKF